MLYKDRAKLDYFDKKGLDLHRECRTVLILLYRLKERAMIATRDNRKARKVLQTHLRDTSS